MSRRNSATDAAACSGTRPAHAFIIDPAARSLNTAGQCSPRVRPAFQGRARPAIVFTDSSRHWRPVVPDKHARHPGHIPDRRLGRTHPGRSPDDPPEASGVEIGRVSAQPGRQSRALGSRPPSRRPAARTTPRPLPGRTARRGPRADRPPGPRRGRHERITGPDRADDGDSRRRTECDLPRRTERGTVAPGADDRVSGTALDQAPARRRLRVARPDRRWGRPSSYRGPRAASSPRFGADHIGMLRQGAQQDLALGVFDDTAQSGAPGDGNDASVGIRRRAGRQAPEHTTVRWAGARRTTSRSSRVQSISSTGGAGFVEHCHPSRQFEQNRRCADGAARLECRRVRRPRVARAPRIRRR